MHQAHGPGCPVPADQHHAHVAPRLTKLRTTGSDPFVRTSMEFRRSDLTYLTSKYGSAVGKLREWIAADRGITGARLRRHIPGTVAKPRTVGGKFAPKPVPPVTFEIPTDEIPANDGVVSNWIEPSVPPGDDEELVL